MDRIEVYEKIKGIADELIQDESVFDRADLAYELEEFGLKFDSLEISALVWEAYDYFNRSANIRKTFMNNARDAYLVDEYEICHWLEENDEKTLFQHLENRLEKGDRSLALFKTINMSGDSAISTISMPMQLVFRIMGTKGARDVGEEARIIFEGYTKMIDMYEIARTDVKAVVSDFVMLRTKVQEMYRQYALALIDVFGDSVKMISPELFDYNSIEWLDVQGMIKDLHLEYEQITNSCSSIINEISDSFSELIKKSVSAFRCPGGSGLVLAGLAVISHYSNTYDKTSRLKADLLKLKNNVNRDANTISGDIGRLFVIYKTLNDLYIPKANAFYKYGGQVFDTELKELLNSIYSTTDSKKMKQRRDEVINECKLLEQQMVDDQFNIDYYTSHISESGVLIENYKPSYDLAVESRPSSPFLLFNILTFNILRKKYNRRFYEWKQQYGALIDEYEDFQLDVKLDSDALLKTKRHLQEKREKHKMLLRELKNITNNISEEIRVDDALKLKVGEHLSSLVQLLKVSKEIVESKLDEKLTNAVSFENKSLISPELQKSVSQFTASMKEPLILVTEKNVQQVEKKVDVGEHVVDTIENRKDMERIYEEEVEDLDSCDGEIEDPDVLERGELETAEKAEERNKAIESFAENMSNLFGEWMSLKEMEKNSKLIVEEYNRELKKLQRKFKNNLEDINDKTEVLKEALKKVNLATTHEELKEGLLSLVGDEVTIFSEKDISDFLNGTKTLEI